MSLTPEIEEFARTLAEYGFEYYKASFENDGPAFTVADTFPATPEGESRFIEDPYESQDLKIKLWCRIRDPYYSASISALHGGDSNENWHIVDKMASNDLAEVLEYLAQFVVFPTMP